MPRRFWHAGAGRAGETPVVGQTADSKAGSAAGSTSCTLVWAKTVTKNESVEKLQRQIAAIKELTQEREGSPSFTKWRRDTAVVIAKIFGAEAKHTKEFEDLRYGLMAFSSSTPPSAHVDAYHRGLARAQAFLDSLITEVEEFWQDEPIPYSEDAVSILRRLCERFHLVARQLRARYGDRSTLDVHDEYDVQDLFHALLLLFFEDVRREEWSPSYAGGSSRLDFLLKAEQFVVETKRARKGLDARVLGEELIIDIQRYQAHPDCKRLLCFVYDPDGRIANPRGIESDLSHSRAGITVVVVIAPSGR